MWDNPRILNMVAGTLVGIAVFVFAIVGVALLARSPLFPVTEVELTHAIGRTTRAQIEAGARAHIRGNFFAGSPAGGRAGLAALRLARPAGSEPRGARRVRALGQPGTCEHLRRALQRRDRCAPAGVPR